MSTRKATVIHKVNKITGAIVETYNTVDDRPDGLKTMIYYSAKNRALLNDQYCYRTEADYDPNEVFSEKAQNRPLVVMDHEKKCAFVAFSRKDAAEIIGVEVSTINSHFCLKRAIKYERILKRYTIYELGCMGQLELMGLGIMPDGHTLYERFTKEEEVKS